MKLDCIKPKDRPGWVVIDTENGHEIAHDERDDDGWAWYKAAQQLAEAITEIWRTMLNVGE